MREGLKIVLSGLGKGLTRDAKGKELLPHPFVFQCPPLEEFKVTHAFTMGNYDTIEQGQFSRRGSRQLMTWQFDTLVVETGMAVGRRDVRSIADPSNPLSFARFDSLANRRVVPGWAAFTSFDEHHHQQPLQWYAERLKEIHDAGAPFRLMATYESVAGILAEPMSVIGPILNTPAVLLGFEQTHKHGETDAVYFGGVSFSEWRDPTQSQKKLGSGHGQAKDTPPTVVTLMPDGVCVNKFHHKIPAQPAHGTKHTTLVDLSRFYYHTPQQWRRIAHRNNIKGGAGNTPLVKFPKYKKIPRRGVKIHIPDGPKFHAIPLPKGKLPPGVHRDP